MSTLPEPQTVSLSPGELLSEGFDLVRGQYWLFVGICAVGLILGGAVPVVLMGAMMCGIYLCLFARTRDEPVRFEMLFHGFDHFVESLIATLVLFGISMALMIPLYFVLVALIFMLAGTVGDSTGAGVVALFIFGVVYAVILLIGFAIGAVFLFTYPLIVDRGMKGIEALKASMAAFRANPVGLPLLVLVCGVLSGFAALFCYLPVFLVAPITLGAVAVAYRRVFPEAAVEGEEQPT
jgi:hypothetical protein